MPAGPPTIPSSVLEPEPKPEPEPEREPIDPDSLPPEPDEHGRYLMNLSPAEVTAVLAKREAAKVARAVVRRVRR